jgi:hypothetical protein
MPRLQRDRRNSAAVGVSETSRPGQAIDSQRQAVAAFIGCDYLGEVFINPNLTRAEAAAAYQARLQRRLSQQRRKEESASIAVVPEGSNNPAQNIAHIGKRQQLKPLSDSFIQPVLTVAASATVTED